MKKSFFICALALTAFISCKNTKDEWKLVWEENFDQQNGFDTAYWTKTPRGTSDWNNYMSDDDRLYDVKDGNLILRGMVNADTLTDTVPYITGGVYTKDKKTFANGRLEIRAKLNGASGAWPAIWMLAQGTKWPDGGEIDIMERLNYDGFAYQTVHSYYTYTLGIKEPKTGGTGKINPNDYNIFGVELYNDSLRLFINNEYTLTYPRIETDKEGQFPYNKPMYLLIDMQLEGSWVGKANGNDLPVEMQIDWVRFYQK